MNTEKKNILLRRIIPGVTVILAALGCAAYYVLVPGNISMVNPSTRMPDTSGAALFRAPAPPPATGEETRIARQFEADTLPALMKIGAVRSVERRNTGTVLAVDRKFWEARSRFFRESLLKQVQTYNKVNGFATDVKAVDAATRQPLARIHPNGRKEFFE